MIATVVLNSTVEGLSLQGWWTDVPFLHIAVSIAIFWMGMTVADIWNRKSQLRLWWREFVRPYDVFGIGRNRIDYEDNEILELFCSLRFKKNLINPLLTVRIHQLRAQDRIETRIVHEQRLGEVQKDKVMRLRLGSVCKALPGATAAFHSIWGSDAPSSSLREGQLSIMGGNQEVIEVSVNNHPFVILAEPIMNHDFRVMLHAEDDRLLRMLP